MLRSCTAFLLLTFAVSAPAEVVDSAPAGFTVRTTLTIKASPAEVYRRFLNVSEWWSSDHTFSSDAHNLSMEEKVNGCFCEKLPDGGGVRHMQIAYLVPGKTIILSGGLGPLLSMPVAGTMQVGLAPVEGGTKLTVTYGVAGYLPAGLNTWAAGVDAVLAEQINRLKNTLEAAPKK